MSGARCVSLSPLSKGSGIVTGSYRVPGRLAALARDLFDHPADQRLSQLGPAGVHIRDRAIDRNRRPSSSASTRWSYAAGTSSRREEMPYRNAVGMTYDSGEYEKSLDMALGLSDPDGFGARKEEAEARGRLLGRGIAHYVESSIGTPIEQTRIRVLGAKRRVEVTIGTQPSGPGPRDQLRPGRRRTPRRPPRRGPHRHGGYR